MPNVEMIAVGSELLTPERMDTNSLWLTAQLNELGFEVTAKTIVGDQRERLSEAFRQAFEWADVVICTGGLGPTEDDVTRDSAAQAWGKPGRFRKPLGRVAGEVHRMGRVTPANNRRQALVLEGAESLPNPSTAPGQWRDPQGPGQKPLVMLPGPPRELKPMFLDHVCGAPPPAGRTNASCCDGLSKCLAWVSQL